MSQALLKRWWLNKLSFRLLAGQLCSHFRAITFWKISENGCNLKLRSTKSQQPIVITIIRQLRTVGIILGFFTLAPDAEAVQIKLGFDAFIPTARVANPLAEVLPPFFTEFIGDNRSFSLEATRNGEARLFSQVVLETDNPNLILSAFSEAGTTVGFRLENGVEVSQSARTTPISSIEAARTGENEIFLKVAASATNPLIDDFLPPEVEVFSAEYIYDIRLTILSNGIGYDLVGTNREFPNYSVFLNQAPILLNPANGTDSLLLGNIEPVSAKGTVTVSEPAVLLALGLTSLLLLRIGKI